MKKLTIFLALAIGIPAYATVPKQISVQGILSQSGQNLTGSHVLKLNLYDALSGGTLLYSDIESVTIANGGFTVFLGNQIPIPDSLKFDRPYYLGISVDNGPELSPRSLLTPTANSFYAIRAGTSDSAVIAAMAVTAQALAPGASAPPSGPASGDLAASYPAPEVVGIASHPVATVAPTPGQTLVWNGSQWTPTSTNAVAFSVVGGTFQTLPHDVFTTIDFTYDNTAGGFDDSGYFSLDSDWFTAPSSGYYEFDSFISVDTRSSPPSEIYLAYFVNGSEIAYRRYYSLVNGGYTQMDYTLPLKLQAGDRVRVKCEPVTNNTTTMGGNAYGVIQFSGFKIH